MPVCVLFTDGVKSKKHKVFFEDPAGGQNRIKFDGCPFIIVGKKSVRLPARCGPSCQRKEEESTEGCKLDLG